MAQDFYVSPTTGDWYLEGGTTIRLCNTYQELTRQRLEINLKMYKGEWFADINYGVPYFTSVFGKNTVQEVDAIFRSTILNTDGVVQILSYNSSYDKILRKYTLVFDVRSTKGDIKDIEVIL